MVEENVLTPANIYRQLQVEQKVIFSEYLERDVIIDFYLPENYLQNEVDLLLINDGQDLVKMNFGNILDPLLADGEMKPLLCVGIHCSADRLNEYGTICRADFKGRGAKAGLYSKFVFDELLPFIKTVSSFKTKSFAGFSLGALSALDIVWNHPHEFIRTGVFSGALWWRRKGYEDESYNWDTDRIMHLQVQKGALYPWLQFFFECGKLDETADRNNNGIIDSIEDTLDLIEDLKTLGYSNDQINYLELEEGAHNVETWASAFPDFLRWGWGKEPLDDQ